MARWQESRQKLFDEFSTNLSFYEPEHKGMFKCPICLKLFTQDYLFWRLNHNSLSVAHFIPKSFLNAGYTLCCIYCDSKFGSKLSSTERMLRHNMRVAKWNNTPYNVKTSFVIGHEDINVVTTLKWDANGFPIPDFRNEDIPNHISIETLRELSVSFTTVDANGMPNDLCLWKHHKYNHKIRYANLNWWHSLYLFMFHHFGYQWVLHDSRANLIREQLQNLDDNIIPDIFLEPQVYPLNAPYESAPHDHLPIRPSLRFGIDHSGNIIDSGFYIIFPKLSEKMEHMTLFLPWDFNTTVRPIPASFTHRLRYGHSVIKHCIPQTISSSDMVNYQTQMCMA